MERLRALLATRLGRYRCMSYVAGTALLLIVFVGVPLQVWANSPGLATWLGYAHGWVLFPVYLVTILQLALATRLRRGRLALMVLGGLIPVLAFVMERQVTRELTGPVGAVALENGAP